MKPCHATILFPAASIAALAFSLCAPTALAAESTFHRTLEVSGPVILSATTGSGDIHITAGAGNLVTITGHVRADRGSSPAIAASIAANPPIAQTGNSIRIGRGENGDLRHVSISYDIATPAGTLLDAYSGSGDLSLSGLTGAVKAETGSGNINAVRLGAGSRLRTGTGDIDARDILGTIRLQNGSGNIRAQFSAPGDVTASSGEGDIHLTNVRGALRASTGTGDLVVSGQPSSPWKLQDGSGDITLSLGSSHYRIDAHTGSGDIRSDVSILLHGSLNAYHAEGDVNGGGPVVKASTGSGDIHIR